MAKKHKFDYFDAFEKQTKIALKEANCLIEAIEQYDKGLDLKDLMDRAHAIEHEGDGVNHAILKTISSDFITPIEREDVIEMASRLDTITDLVEGLIQRFYMFDIKEIHPQMIEFAELIRKSIVALGKAMEDFRNFKKSKKFKQLVIDVNTYEEEADRLYLELQHELHANHRDDPIYVMSWAQMFQRMEACCDACEHTADVMGSILLKNS